MPRRRAIAVDLDNCLLNPAFYRRIQGVEPETTHLQNALAEQVKSINPEGKDEDKLGVEQLKQLVAARVNYLDKLNQEFIASNQPVITLFNGNKHLYASTDTYLFSNRQSLSDDMTNSNINKSGSGFHYYRLFSQHIGATPSFMLMSDIFTNSPYGSSLKVILGFLDAANDYDANKVKAARENNFKAPEWMHDRLKLIIAFAQMFDFAQRFPDDNGEKHDFFILDDKAQILDALHAYLKMYPGLIPSNIRLHLIRYEGSLNPDGTPIAKVIHYYTPLEGTGNLNIDYKAEVKIWPQ